MSSNHLQPTAKNWPEGDHCRHVMHRLGNGTNPSVAAESSVEESPPTEQGSAPPVRLYMSQTCKCWPNLRCSEAMKTWQKINVLSLYSIDMYVSSMGQEARRTWRQHCTKQAALRRHFQDICGPAERGERTQKVPGPLQQRLRQRGCGQVREGARLDPLVIE